MTPSLTLFGREAELTETETGPSADSTRIPPPFLRDLGFLVGVAWVDVGVVLEGVDRFILSSNCLLYLRKRRKDFGGGWSSSLSGGKSPFLHQVGVAQDGYAKHAHTKYLAGFVLGPL